MSTECSSQSAAKCGTDVRANESANFATDAAADWSTVFIAYIPAVNGPDVVADDRPLIASFVQADSQAHPTTHRCANDGVSIDGAHIRPHGGSNLRSQWSDTCPDTSAHCRAVRRPHVFAERGSNSCSDSGAFCGPHVPSNSGAHDRANLCSFGRAVLGANGCPVGGAYVSAICRAYADSFGDAVGDANGGSDRDPLRSANGFTLDRAVSCAFGGTDDQPFSGPFD